MPFPLRAAAALLALIPAAATAQQPATSFTPAQRDEIVAIVRDALKSDPSILRDAITALQQDQQGRAAAASSQAIAANHAALFANPADPVAGNPTGRVTLVEFFDIRCPYCLAMRPDLDALLRAEPDVKLILKDLPVLGPASLLGAKALLAAQAQGGYLKLQDALMVKGATIDEPAIRHAAQQAGLDWSALRQAMDSPAIQARIDANLALAKTLGVDGTPAFVIGDQLVSGAMSPAELTSAVASLRR